MSVFFEYPTDLQSKAKGAVLATAFSNGDQHILAAATKNGDITMYLEEVRSEAARDGSGTITRLEIHSATAKRHSKRRGQRPRKQ